MEINYDKDDYEVDVKMHVCEFHKEHPDQVSYAGCTCSASYTHNLKNRPKGQDSSE